ncbi:MAG: hypothetical protein WA990_04315 [Rubrobacteraceae bacterium]
MLERVKWRLDGLRWPLGSAFLAAYAWTSFSPASTGTVIFLGVGIFLYVLSVPWASSFHRMFALVALSTLTVSLATGRFVPTEFFEGLPQYFDIVAVLIVLSVAGYPIRAVRYEAHIRALIGRMSSRGISPSVATGALGHVLGAVLDVGAFVLIDVIARRAMPDGRTEALMWAGRAFTFVPLWSNLNVMTATTIGLTGVYYPDLLLLILPFVLVGLALTLFYAQRTGSNVEAPPDDTGTLLDRGTAAVLLYPILLVTSVGIINHYIDQLSLIAVISLTIAVIVVFLGVLATILTRSFSPILRLARETRGALTSSHAEFALFGSAGVLVLSLQSLGALDPIGTLFESLPAFLIAPGLTLFMALGFLIGIHVIPMVLMIDTVFPLDSGSSPALWAAAILLGSQVVLLLTPFSNAVTMLSRLTALHPLDIGFKRNWTFSLLYTISAITYLGLLTLLLSPGG